MTKGVLILPVIVAVFLCGCASFHEPTDTKNALVIGQIVEIASNYPSYGEASVNGTTKIGIELTFKNLKDNSVYVVKSFGGGVFSSTDMSPGKYRLMRLYLKIEVGGAWATVYSTRPTYFDVSENCVSNLGLIYWICDYGAATKYHQSSGYAEVKDQFNKGHSESGWNQKEWKEIQLQN